jgi:hypothetical protein
MVNARKDAGIPFVPLTRELKKTIIGVLCGSLITVFVFTTEAKTIGYTGSELVSEPAVSFPGAIPKLKGKSIVFNARDSEPNKLLVLPIISGLGSRKTAEVYIEINFTRLPCLSSIGCTDATENDAHYIIGLSDGSTLVAIALGESDNKDNSGVISALEFKDLGKNVELQSNSTWNLLKNCGYPTIGASFDVKLWFMLDYVSDPSTKLRASFLSNTASARMKGLDLTAVTNFVFLGKAGEQYQINSLTIRSQPFFSDPYEEFKEFVENANLTALEKPYKKEKIISEIDNMGTGILSYIWPNVVPLGGKHKNILNESPFEDPIIRNNREKVPKFVNPISTVLPTPLSPYLPFEDVPREIENIERELDKILVQVLGTEGIDRIEEWLNGKDPVYRIRFKILTLQKLVKR